jgi:glycosyltransferase involved in cell wall biosynthesis
MSRPMTDTSLSSPLVSVIIPTCRRPHMLGRALDSVLRQTFQDFEVLVVDDAADGSAEPVVSMRPNPAIHYIRHSARRGASAARNTGIDRSTGYYIAFLDDDDEWDPDKLRKQVERFAESEVDPGVVYAGSMKVSERTGETLSVSPPRPLRNGHVDFLRSTRFGTSVPLIRRACFDRVGLFDEDLPGTQDRDMWIRLAREFRFDFVPEILVRHYLHGDQITSDLPRKVEAKQAILAKYRVDLEAHPGILAEHLHTLGMLCCADRQHENGRVYLLRAIRARPFRVRAYRDWLRSRLAPRRFERQLRTRTFVGGDGVPSYY